MSEKIINPVEPYRYAILEPAADKRTEYLAVDAMEYTKCLLAYQTNAMNTPERRKAYNDWHAFKDMYALVGGINDVPVELVHSADEGKRSLAFLVNFPLPYLDGDQSRLCGTLWCLDQLGGRTLREHQNTYLLADHPGMLHRLLDGEPRLERTRRFLSESFPHNGYHNGSALKNGHAASLRESMLKSRSFGFITDMGIAKLQQTSHKFQRQFTLTYVPLSDLL